MFHVKISDYKTLLSLSESYTCLKKNYETATNKIKCTLIPGDGVGPELCKSVKLIFNAAKVPVDFEKHIFSELHPEQSESLENVVKSIRKNRICLQGVVAVPEKSRIGNPNNWNMRLREALDLYANVVHIQSIKGVPCKQTNMNLFLIRDQTEGSYKETLEHETVKGVVDSLRTITKKKSERIAKFAFDFATTHYRKNVVAVHKANLFRITDGLFLESCRKIAKHYPKIKFSDLTIGSCAFQLIKNPQVFDVILTPSLYGSVIENVGIGVVGGPGVVPGYSFSPRCAVFEPGSKHIYNEAKGLNVANPTVLILSAIKLLKHIKLIEYAGVIEDALYRVLREKEIRTHDMGGDATTQDFTKAVINYLDIDRFEEYNYIPKKKNNIIYRLSTCS